MFGKPIRITDGIFQLRAIGARVTVLAQQGEAILVDSGLPGSSHVISHGLSEYGYSMDRVSRIVITHAHPDHSGGLAEFVDKNCIEVAVHESEADIVEGAVPAPSPFRSPWLAFITSPFVSMLNGSPVPVQQRLKDGDLIPFPVEVRVVHLPGHTPGSIGLYLPEKKVVIVGDALQHKFGWRLYPPAPGVTSCPSTAMRSLEKLLTLNFNTICFGHFPPLRKEARGALHHLIERSSPPDSISMK